MTAKHFLLNYHHHGENKCAKTIYFEYSNNANLQTVIMQTASGTYRAKNSKQGAMYNKPCIESRHVFDMQSKGIT